MGFLRKCAAAALAALFALSLSGCGYPELYERILIHGVGVDLCGEGYRVTVRSSSSVEDEGEELFTAEGDTVLEALSQLSLSTGREPFYAHNYLVVFGMDCARAGLDRCLDFFIRYYNTRPAVSVFLAEGTAEEVLSAGEEGKLKKMSELQALGSGGKLNGLSADVELLDFVNGALKEGGSPVMPVLRAEEEGVRAVGTGYFEEYRLKGLLTLDQTRGYLAAVGQLDQGELAVSGEETGDATLSIRKARGEISLGPGKDVPEFRIRIDVDADLSSASQAPGNQDAFYAALEREAEEVLQAQAGSALRQAVAEDGCDIFGFGNLLYRKRPEFWRENGGEWGRLMSEGQYEVQVDVKVRRLEQENLERVP